jgi:hypothetical protein
VVVEISTRLLSRIQLDFPHHTQTVIDKLGTLDALVVQSGQDPERMLAAVVRCAAGRLDRLDRALADARLDWRDLLVAADLADHAWRTRLSAWLDPAGPPLAAPSPGASGQLLDPDGRRWQVRRRHIDLRIVKRLIRRPHVVVMLGESGGFRLRTVAAHERGQLWEVVRHAYTGPGGRQPVTSSIDYTGYEFMRDDAVMLYLEQQC